MWVLESDADFFRGKRLWLKPGKQYLFGRVKKDGVRFAIDHKTISRKHFVITVDEVKPGDAAKIHARSSISITDQKSKQGTFVDGEILSNDTRELKGTEHSIRPGHLQQDLVIKWQPCVLTFSITSKEAKNGALKPKQARLEELDIKAISEYINDVTTHVVAGKRNTAKGLQALIQGKRIVADSYIDALVYAATPADLGEEENLSLLEQDFDSSWPKESEHLPPAGKEPTIRPNKSYAPEVGRNRVFENFTFVFGDKKQYDQLHPAISLGQGKGLLYKVVDGETNVDEVVQYMRNTAGQKGFGDAQKDSNTGGVIMVRWTGKEPHIEWTQNLINEVALKLDQRAIDQAEFLDAILGNNAFSLRSSIPFESTTEGRAAPPPSAAVSFASIRQLGKGASRPPIAPASSFQAPLSAAEASPMVQPAIGATQETQRAASFVPEPATKEAAPSTSASQDETTPRPKRSRLRGAPIAKFFKFDDGFDADSIDGWVPPSQTGSAALEQPQSRSPSYSYSQEPSVAPQIKHEPPFTQKRRRSPFPSKAREQSFDDEMDDLLPAATSMKRRKLAVEAEARASGEPVRAVKPKAIPAYPKKPKKKEVELDVREAVRERHKKDEEAAEREREDLAEGLGYENDRQPANLAMIETMKVQERKPSEPANSNQDSNWDPKWNGRKNFKRFVKVWPGRDNQAALPMRRRQNVIVPLVEVKKSTYGIGEQYWDKPKPNEEDDMQRRKKKSLTHTQTQRETQTQNRGSHAATPIVALHNDDDLNAGLDQSPTSPISPASTSPTLSRLQAEAASIVDHAINTDTPRRTRLADKTNTQTQTQSSRSTVPQKRGASSNAKSQGVEKRPKTIPVQTVHGSDSDDSDDMKFRFGKRVTSKRTGGGKQ